MTFYERKIWDSFGLFGAEIYPLPQEGQRSFGVVIVSSRAPQSPPSPGMHWNGGVRAEGPSHCPPDAKCQFPCHL